MSCGTSCCKFFLFSFNLLFALCSLALFLMAVMAQITILQYYDIENDTENAQVAMVLPLILWILIGISGFAFLLAFMGCLGAIRESRCLIFGFGTILAVVLVVELASVGVGYSMQDKMMDQLQDTITQSMPLYPKNVKVAHVWDVMQTDLNCCGLYGPDDWHDFLKSNSSSEDILPDSCCLQLLPAERCTNEDESNVRTIGCLNEVMNKLKDKTLWIYLVALVIGIIEIFGVIISCCLGFSITDTYRTV